MIKKKLLYKCLGSIHAMVIKARKMAYDKNNHEDIASLLDETEYLLKLIADPNDQTILFRKHLELIGKRFNWYLPIERFDDNGKIE